MSMTNKAQPDHSQEAAQIREELRGREDALLALDHLAREEQADVALPPVPEDLREQWKERYGEASKKTTPPEEATTHQSYNIWGLGSMATIAAVAMFLIIRNGGPEPLDSDQPFGPEIMRGGGTFSATPETVTIFIASDQVSYQDMIPTRKAGLILEAKDEEDVQRVLMQHQLNNAILVNAATGMLFPIPGQAGDEIQLIANPKSADQYDFGEAIDAFLSQ